MRHTIRTFLLTCSLILSGCATTGTATGPCSDCSPAEYCAADHCNLQNGACKQKPTRCTKIYAPVCGCDGKDYPSDCVAASAGISVKHTGRCNLTSACSSNADCAQGMYCKKESCTAPQGQCSEQPQMCALIYLPVCGCDDLTYGNSCGAAAKGMNIKAEGECA